MYIPILLSYIYMHSFVINHIYTYIHLCTYVSVRMCALLVYFVLIINPNPTIKSEINEWSYQCNGT